jgi:hypothetical protein
MGLTPRSVRWRARLVAVIAFLSSPQLAGAQAPGSQEGWNAPRARELVRMAQDRRSEQQVDPEMLSYRADARGYVYFILDHPESARQSLVRTDQVAVEVYWRAPNEVRQRIVGLRERSELPVRRLYYYLDRMTVVQDNFGDGIVIADGENVNDVPHPAAPGSDSIYDFRLADSLTLRLAGAPEPIRVLELNVRPRDPTRPAVVGSMFLDATSGALVKLEFTFTRAAYTDRRLDHINVVLENGLWRGRFWLPHEQRLEIRRELPELDFPLGTIIRTRMRVGNYVFNEPIPHFVFYSPRVTIAPRDERNAFEFEQEIDAERRLEGIGRPLQMDELRREARSMMRQHAMSGLPRTRLHLAGASDLFRYNRAEGAALGLGATFAPAPRLSMRVRGGWAFGAELAQLRFEAEPRVGPVAPTLSLFLNQPRDIGVGPAASGAINTLSSVLAGRDYTDLFTASGGALTWRPELGRRLSAEAGVRLEAHRSLARTQESSLFTDTEFREVGPVDEGDLLGGWVSVSRSGGQGTDRGWWASLRADGGRLGSDVEANTFVRPQVRLALEQSWGWRESSLVLEADAGYSAGTLPRQSLYLLGGRGTVAGHDFRRYGGGAFGIAGGSLSADVYRPWLRGHLLAQAGWAGAAGAGDALGRWGAEPTGSLIGSIGGGLGVFYDLLRVNTARGLGGDGHWELWIEARRGFWDWL